MEQFLDVFGTKSFGPNNDGYRDNWRNWTIKTRVIHAVIVGIDKYIEQDSVELANDHRCTEGYRRGINGEYEYYKKTIL